MRRILLASAVAALMAVMAASSAAAQAESETVVNTQSVSYILSNPCNGELIPTTGLETMMFHYTNSDHNQAVVSQYVFRGSGVGEITGARYAVNNPSHATLTIHEGNTATFAYHTNIIGAGQVPDFRLYGLEHFTLTPGGMSVHFDNFRYECKG
jgi:hypothetical protein